MKLQLKVLSGARSGVTAVFSRDQVVAGRHPGCDLPFDPEKDLDVSTRHALFVRAGPRWMVRDAGSRNGTLVNGHPIRGDTTLSDTDQVRLGKDGPVVEVRLVSDAIPDRPPPPTAAAAAGAVAQPVRQTAGVTAPQAAPRAPSTTQRIRLEVGRQTRRLRLVALALAAVLIAGGAYVVVERQRAAAERERERAATQARVDSILAASSAAIAQLQGQVEGLADALRASQNEIQRHQRDLEAAEAAGRSTEVTRLRRELAAATQALSLQQAAANVDFRRIHEARNPAIALIWTEFAPGDVATGTAFAVTPGGVLITNRHVVYGADGARTPRRLAIQFANSAQVWPATPLGASQDVDLAVLQVQRVTGAVPWIPIPDSIRVRPGDPIATIGFPGGTDLPMRSSGEERIVRTTLTAGTVSKTLPDLLQIDGYGAQGASGSPIFSASGALLGVLYGGEAGSNGRIVYAVPVPYVTALLRELSVVLPG
jgi:S1-C subfamily serine protease